MDQNPAAVGELFETVTVLMMRHVPAPDGLSLTAAATLGSLQRRGPRRITELATAQGVTQPSMTQLLRRLEDAGLVGRVPDPTDGRVVLIELTEAGDRTLRNRWSTRLARLDTLLATLSDEERAVLERAAEAALPVAQKLVHTLAARD
ncbi:MarR family transcriptional regulator [Catenulispora yoronensis]|uniref:MarR family winged helix-turn-helix transcriptional regulator n=1 Tax=Catenulispora yoronensis TaxID=450799 RepID=UPI0031D2B093